MKNAYARKIIATRAVLSKAREMEIIDRTVRIMLQIFGIALNRVLGIGPDRFARIQAETISLFEEYDKAQQVDQEYADAKLEEAYSSIMARRPSE